MTWTLKQARRLALEEKLIEREPRLAGFQFHDRRGATYVEGLTRPARIKDEFCLRIPVPPNYPHEKPCLYVIRPKKLWKQGRKVLLNHQGRSHSFHTEVNGPDGVVSICHSEHWDVSQTLMQVVFKGILWCKLYAVHLQTGQTIAELLKSGLAKQLASDPLRLVGPSHPR